MPDWLCGFRVEVLCLATSKRTMDARAALVEEFIKATWVGYFCFVTL